MSFILDVLANRSTSDNERGARNPNAVRGPAARISALKVPALPRSCSPYRARRRLVAQLAVATQAPAIAKALRFRLRLPPRHRAARVEPPAPVAAPCRGGRGRSTDAAEADTTVAVPARARAAVATRSTHPPPSATALAARHAPPSCVSSCMPTANAAERFVFINGRKMSRASSSPKAELVSIERPARCCASRVAVSADGKLRSRVGRGLISRSSSLRGSLTSGRRASSNDGPRAASAAKPRGRCRIEPGPKSPRATATGIMDRRERGAGGRQIVNFERRAVRRASVPTGPRYEQRPSGVLTKYGLRLARSPASVHSVAAGRDQARAGGQRLRNAGFSARPRGALMSL